MYVNIYRLFVNKSNLTDHIFSALLVSIFRV